MTEFENPYLHPLRNEEHVALHLEINDILVHANLQALGIEPRYLPFKQALDTEVALLDVIRKSVYTKKIHAQDMVREKLFCGLRDAVKSALHHYDSKHQEAAEVLQIVFDKYGNVANRSLDSETSAIDDLIRELNDNHGAAMSTLKLGEWTTKLSAANEKFRELIEARDVETGERPKLRIRVARAETDKCLRALFHYIDALVTINGQAKYEHVINSINAEIERFKHRLAQEAGMRHGKSGKKADD